MRRRQKKAHAAAGGGRADPPPAAAAASSSGVSSSSSSSSRARLASRVAHIRSLDLALAARPISIDALRDLSRGGFQDDERRRVVWPMLLGVDVPAMDREAERRQKAIEEEAAAAAAAGGPATAAASAHALAASSSSATAASSPGVVGASVLPRPYDYSTSILFSHRYHDQIEKDIARSMCHFDCTKHMKARRRAFAREALGRIIHTIFSRHPDLHYIQGFHDIASVFLLVCHAPSDPSHPWERPWNARGEELAYRLTERLALLHIRDSLRPSLDTVVEVLSLIFPLLRVADPEVHDFLVRTNVQSFFTLSWILTWFSHNLERYQDICRVFDFFLSSHPLMPLYSTVALIIQLRAGLLDLRVDAVRTWRANHGLPVHAPIGSLPTDDQVEVDMSAVHAYFQKLPPVLDLDALFASTARLVARHPPLALLKQGRLKIPTDSPLLAGSALDQRALVSKLGNYLAWQTKQMQDQMRKGTWGRIKKEAAGTTAAARRRRGSSNAAATPAGAATRSFYTYPPSNRRWCCHPRNVFLLVTLLVLLCAAAGAFLVLQQRPDMAFTAWP